MQKETLIHFIDISKSFGKKNILNKINLEINKGEIFGILGPSGSGKSTLMKVLMGLIQPDHGIINYDGIDITKDSSFLRKLIGLTTQENSFYDKLTVYENMKYYANLYSVNLEKQKLNSFIDSLLRSVHLLDAKNKVSDQLSGGMKRRLDFAISLLHDPKLLILDEPTTGLDPSLVKEFWKIVKTFSSQGKTILVISHIFPEIHENCNRVGILFNGKIKTLEITKKTDLIHEFEKVIS